MVLLMRLETTSPTTSLRRPCTVAAASIFVFVLASAIIVSPLLLLACGRARTLSGDRLHPRNVLAQSANLLQALGLPHVQLKLQLEELVGQFAFLMLQLFFGKISNLLCLHRISFFGTAAGVRSLLIAHCSQLPSASPLRASPAWSAGPACATPGASPLSRRRGSRLPSRTEFFPALPPRPNDRARPCPCPYGFRPASW